MGEIGESINQKNSILLSRNRPVALVVGAAGFLGSHIVDKLLDKDIQVVAVDSLKSGKKENLRKAAEKRDFHLVLESIENFNFSFERLDYLFIVDFAEEMEDILQYFKATRCRSLLISKIELYEEESSGELKKLKEAESRLAKFASDHNLNARILRLGAIFGPRMEFDSADPLIKLLQKNLNGSLQEETSLDFSSRALYVQDAVELVLKTMLAGSTAQKIFDGVNPNPVKVSEIKQVLLDPVWYENRDFIFSELPPWPTPNLEKTMKFLNWKPKTNLLKAFRETLSYFKENEITVPKTKVEDESFKKEIEAFKNEEKKPEEKKIKKGRKLPKFSIAWGKIYLFLIIGLITYALIWPAFIFGWGIWTFRSQLNSGFENLEKGDFERSLENFRQASLAQSSAKSVFAALEPFGITNNNVLTLSDSLIVSAEDAVSGIKDLLQGLKSVTGEQTDSPSGYFDSAREELSSANESISKVEAILAEADFKKKIPAIFQAEINKLENKVRFYRNFINKAQAIAVLLPNLVGLEGSKNYLILLQNNMELRPGGGFIGSFAKVNLEGGKLKKLNVNDIYAIDGALSIHVEPPKEIKEDLGQKNWYLRDSNFEPDFPTSARQAEWFYTKETGEKVEGVIAMDVSAMERLLEAIGPLDLSDYSEKITSDNLFEKAVSHAEMSFFPGSQAKKSFLTALANEAFNKMFFLPQNNWPAIISALSKSLSEKHISIYLDDPKLFSYVDSEGWAHVLPRGTKENQNEDFLSLVEANMGANKANYYLDRTYNLETVIGKEGEIKHRLRIGYTNRSPSDAFPGGKYKNRMRIYLPFGSKMIRALWGETDLTKDISAFVDYGRSGYSILLELAPKEQKNLVLDYSVPVKVEFKDGKAGYRLNIIKQAGALKDPLRWSLTFPISYKINSEGTKTGPQEQTILTDLSEDRSFAVEFKR